MKRFQEFSQRTISREDMEECLNNTIGKGQELTLQITGYSMSPTLKHLRDRVILTDPKAVGIRRMDMVLYRRENGKYVLHRIIQCYPPERYLLNGDAQLWTEMIRKEQIRAVVSSIERNGRRISCRNQVYLLYVRLWVCLKPVRGWIITCYQRWKSLKRL